MQPHLHSLKFNVVAKNMPLAYRGHASCRVGTGPHSTGLVWQKMLQGVGECGPVDEAGTASQDRFGFTGESAV